MLIRSLPFGYIIESLVLSSWDVKRFFMFKDSTKNDGQIEILKYAL